MTPYYEYAHRAGYGRDDHRANELIARAARLLGLDTGMRVAQCIGLASHAVPMGGATVRLDGAKARTRMIRALREARTEIGYYVDVSIVVVCRRERREYDYIQRAWSRVHDGSYRPDDGIIRDPVLRAVVMEERRGKVWTEIDRVEVVS